MKRKGDTMLYKRTLEQTINDVNNSFKVLLLTGARQVGKSTLLNSIKEPNRQSITLDNLEILQLAKNDPKAFFDIYKPPLLIDEIQKAPELFIYIKQIVDKSDKTGMFWLTGSQKFTLMRGVSESLAGRIAILELFGLSTREKLEDYQSHPFLPSIDTDYNSVKKFDGDIFEYIFKGSYPQLYKDDKTSLSMYFRSYIQTYLLRDIREISNIGNELNFLNFLKILASRTGTTINYSDIANNVGTSPNTIKNWCKILETLDIIYFLYPYYTNNIGKRFSKTPKMYFLDTGLAAYLCGFDNANAIKMGPLSGAFVETYTITEIIKSYANNGKGNRLYFYRTNNKKEIDLIIEQDCKAYPIEIKQTSTPDLSMSKNFSLIKDAKRGTGAILSLSKNYAPFTKDVLSIPIKCL